MLFILKVGKTELSEKRFMMHTILSVTSSHISTNNTTHNWCVVLYDVYLRRLCFKGKVAVCGGRRSLPSQGAGCELGGGGGGGNTAGAGGPASAGAMSPATHKTTQHWYFEPVPHTCACAYFAYKNLHNFRKV